MLNGDRFTGAEMEERPKEIDNLLDFVVSEIKKDQKSPLEIKVERQKEEIKKLKEENHEKRSN